MADKKEEAANQWWFTNSKKKIEKRILKTKRNELRNKKKQNEKFWQH